MSEDGYERLEAESVNVAVTKYENEGEENHLITIEDSSVLRSTDDEREGVPISEESYDTIRDLINGLD